VIHRSVSLLCCTYAVVRLRLCSFSPTGKSFVLIDERVRDRDLPLSVVVFIPVLDEDLISDLDLVRDLDLESANSEDDLTSNRGFGIGGVDSFNQELDDVFLECALELDLLVDVVSLFKRSFVTLWVFDFILKRVW